MDWLGAAIPVASPKRAAELEPKSFFLRSLRPRRSQSPSEETMPDPDNQSLRGFLARLQNELPEELLRIKEPVSPRLEMTSAVYELERLGKSPVVMFENV